MEISGFSDRMKYYEGMETKRRFLPFLPVCARLDGRSFHRFTKDMKRPYDEGFSNLMVVTMEDLVKETNALIGYTQSDEISLIFYSEDIKSQIFFDGKIQKMVSILASTATRCFNSELSHYFYDKRHECPVFDCRVWSVPTKMEAANVLLWREQDATRNSVSMAAQYYYSHKELHLKNSSHMQDMLIEKGINWNDYPSFFKRGSYAQRRTVKRKLTKEDLEKLPPKHNARKNPDMEFERSEIWILEMPSFSKVVNRVEVVFEGADPIKE